MSFRQPRSAIGRNGSTSRRGSAVSPSSVPATDTLVADVNPTYTIRGAVRCVETINDRIAWTAEDDGTLKIRSLPKGTELKVIHGRPRTKCSALLYMEPQQQMWAAFEDGFVRVYAVLQSELACEFVATETPGAAATALLEVEGMVFVAGEDGSLTQWDSQSLNRMRALPGHLSSIRCLGCYMGPTGSVVFSGGDDGTTKAWDPYLESAHSEGDGDGSNNPCMFTFTGHAKGAAVRAIEVVNSVNQMWTAGNDATVRVWNLETLDCVAVLKGHTAPVTSLLCIESRMWSGDEDGHVMLWDITSCKPLSEISSRLDESVKGGILAMRRVLPSTSWKVWTARGNGTVQCWNAETVPILFNNTKKKKGPAGKKGGRGVDEDADEVQAWRQFQSTIMDSHQREANSDGRRPSLGIVDIQRLADELGYERGRMEVQRELQTQQLLEEENAQLKNRLKALVQRQQKQQEQYEAELGKQRQDSEAQTAKASSPRSRAGAASGPSTQTSKAAVAPSAVLPASGSRNARDVLTTTVAHKLPGADWAYVLSEKPHELRDTARDEVSVALGVPAAQITRLDFSTGSLVIDADVQHHQSVSPAEMKKRLQSYTFPQLQQMHQNARTTPKVGLDAAEANLCALEQKLQDLTDANQELQEQLQRGAREASTPPSSPSPRHPAQDDQQYSQLLALKDAELRRLQDQLNAERDNSDYVKTVLEEKERQRAELEAQLAELKKSSGTPTSQALAGYGSGYNNNNNITPNRQPQPSGRGRALSSMPSVSDDGPSVELSPSPPAIDRTNNKAGRPHSLTGSTPPSEADGFRSPSQDGLQSPEAGLHGVAQPSSGPAAAHNRPPTAPVNMDELRKLRAENAKLKEDYEALDTYLQDRMKPLVAELKRAKAELGVDVARLEKEKAELQEQLASANTATDLATAAGASRFGQSTSQFGLSSVNDDVESIARSQSAGTNEDMANLRRELRKSQADAAAKGTALRKVQRELDVLKRAMESEAQDGGGGMASLSTPLPVDASESRERSTDAAAASVSATIDAAVERELAAKDAELQQLRADYQRLAEYVDKDLKPELEELKRTLADRDAQLQLYEQEVANLRDSLDATAGDGEESRVRNVKMGEAMETLQQELEKERNLRDDLQRELDNERATAKNAALTNAVGIVHSSTSSRAGTKKSQSQDSVARGRGTQPTFMDGGAEGGAASHGLEAQNLALSVRLADSETVIGELQSTLERTNAQLDAQRRETDRLMNIVADLQENSGGNEL